MHIETREVGDVVILDLQGKMTIGEGDESLMEKIRTLVQKGQMKVLINFDSVPYVDNAGLGAIVHAYTVLHRNGGTLKLVYLTKRISDLLAITKLHTVFETFEDEATALKSFAS